MALTLNGNGTISSLPNHEDLTVNSGGVVNPTSIPYIGRRNLIINGAMEVAQRGTSFTSNGYGIDRWKTYNSGGTATLTQQSFASGDSPEVGIDNYVRIVRSSPGGIYYFSQRVEDVRKSDSATLTMSFYGKASATTTVGCRITQEFGSGGSPGVNITAQNVNFTTTWQKHSVTFNMGSLSGKTVGTGNNFEPVFDIPATTETIEITGVQVEYGEVATPFEHRSYGEELASCLRYYEFMGNFDVVSQGHFLSVNNTYAAIQVPSSMPMRVTPTVYGTLENRYGGGGGDWLDMKAGGGSISPKTTPAGKVHCLVINTGTYNWTGNGWVRCSSDYAYDAEL